MSSDKQSYSSLSDYTITLNNLHLLQFDFQTAEHQYGVKYTPDSFQKSNQKAMAAITYFILSLIYDETELESVNKVYFPRTLTDFQNYIKEILTMYQRMINNSIIPSSSLLTYNILELSYGERFFALLRFLTEGIMAHFLKQDPYDDMPVFKGGDVEDIDTQIYAANSHITSIMLEINTLLKEGVETQKSWKDGAEAINNVYSSIIKSKDIEKQRKKLIVSTPVNQQQLEFSANAIAKINQTYDTLKTMKESIDYSCKDTKEVSVVKGIKDVAGLVVSVNEKVSSLNI